MNEQPEEIQPPRRRKRRIAAALLLLLLLLVLALWLFRLPLASDFLRREFERRDVQATYKVTQIGFGRQRVENLVIGSPSNPDLTAKWVELEVSWGFRRPKITLITARGVRLKGRLVGGKFRFGEVDKLLPPPTGAPFRFPDMPVDVADASLSLDTPAGRVGLALAGRGNLSNGFQGEVAGFSRNLALGTCRLASPRVHWKVAIDAGKPRVAGPASAASVGCGRDFLLQQPNFALNGGLSERLDAWAGKAGVEAAGARIAGNALGALSGTFDFDGNAQATKGAVDLAAAWLRVSRFTAGRTRVEGRYSVSPKSGDATLVADVGANGVNAGFAAEGLAKALAATGGTPIEAVGESLAASIRRAAGAFDLAGELRLVNATNGGGVRFGRLIARSRSGARLTLEGGEGLTYAWPTNLSRIDGTLNLSGGGFPQARFALNQPRLGGPISGSGRVAPITAGSSRLALGPIRFTAGDGGATRIDTVATLDGPFDNGAVTGLVVPVSGRLDGRGGFAFGTGCVSARFTTFRYATLRLGAATLPLCPTGRALLWKGPGSGVEGGATLRPLHLAGRLGNTPIDLLAARFLFGLQGKQFAATSLAVRLGSGEAVNRLNAAAFSGRFDRQGLAGRYSGLDAKLAAVPLLLSEGAGNWSLRGGALLMTGALKVADAVDPPRFYPLVAPDFRLTLQNNQIRAGGWLNDPETGTQIVQADIAHALGTGAGRATLDVPGLRFDKSYQPEQLTRLTTGVVALVEGVLSGRGEIAWDGRGTTSSGSFGTDDMDFAAAFGPVEGFRTRVNFTDLLGLTSAPAQLAEADVIRTGIDVFDGRIRYQLLPGLRVKVEAGAWPFAGGELRLEETILDFSKPTAKRLTFRVIGLDAALFIQQMEFSNLSATGTFDGIIPMVFDERGGRIVGGSLVARPEGGTLSYIGELTDKQLGVYGKLAFDALKSLRYSKLTIGLDGALEGEFVAAIELDGIARDPNLTTAPSGGISGLVANRALTQLAKIPFEFNISVRGPFRSLLATMRSFEDPTNLIQSVLPEKLRPRDPLAPAETPQPETKTVQPQESETMQ
ncbi:MAG TPA: YdbH domain-containing protein [Allosphingosinicella sp.]